MVVASYEGNGFSLGGACGGERARARRWFAFHCRRDSKVSTREVVFVVNRAILASLVGCRPYNRHQRSFLVSSVGVPGSFGG